MKPDEEMSAKHVDVSCRLSPVSVTVGMSAVLETNEPQARLFYLE